MYQAASPSPEGVGTVRVVLTFEVPAGFVELPMRTAQLADEYGRIIARSVPGVRVRPAEISTARSSPPVAVTPPAGLVIGRNDAWVGGVRLRLTRREFELLRHLAERHGQPVSRGELMAQVWQDPQVSARTVDTHVRRLRTKLGGYARALRTVRGSGYRWEPADLPDLTHHNVTVTGPTALHTKTVGLPATAHPRPLAT
ncbi:winged helix-turn-helix transcriptional regulator [Mycolicibacterium fluoranthenivorans]|uniref:Winged helix-turn-helix transcriptional regulator n=1 Tax=Mycolicibacterium fluoranthenivorans TaxID=258505 RepID=A0A7G8P8R0_9MYCO|nr:winged helix-turn-helix domain-containing protein [Mycolicibacterium fluoranthenivorans]QNJ90726.1 winged helix-turn-helix transcriptional regulator [Mycolicibacterium fluoranthenivorans]